MSHPIVIAARRWMGVRFCHQGRSKETGVDCLGLLIGVAEELDLCGKNGAQLSDFDARDYGHIPDGEYLQATLDRLLIRVSTVQAGDIALMCFDKNPQHLAIISDYPQGGFGLIHALAQTRKVVEHRLDAAWEGRVVGVYRALHYSHFI